MDIWEIFDETSLPDKEAFYSSKNMEDVTDVDYRHAKRVFKNHNNKNLGDLYVKSDTLLLAAVFENFRNKCTGIYELDPTKTEIKLELLANVYMLLMVEKGIRGRICHAIHAKANKKYMKNYDKNKESIFGGQYMNGQCLKNCL